MTNNGRQTSKASKRAAAHLPQTVHVLLSSDFCFTSEDAARLLAIVGLPRTTAFDNDQAASQLNDAVASAIGWGQFQRNMPRLSEYARQLRNIEAKANALLDALGYEPAEKDPHQFQSIMLRPFYSALHPIGVEQKLPRWLGTGLGLLPRYSEEYQGGYERGAASNQDHPELGTPEPSSESLEDDAIAAAASTALAEFPRYLKLVSLLADLKASEAERSERPPWRNIPRGILFQGFAQLHFDAFGRWPKIVRDATGERNCPAVRWASAVIDHAAAFLRARGADRDDVQCVASLNVGVDALGKALQAGTKIRRGAPGR